MIVASIPERRRGVVAALGLAALVVAVEYGARHILAYALPTIAARRVNDMLACGVAYLALSLVFARVQREELAPRAGWLTAARRWQPWLGVIAALATLPIGFVDRALLACEKRSVVMSIAVQHEPPHRAMSFAILTNAGP